MNRYLFGVHVYWCIDVCLKRLYLNTIVILLKQVKDLLKLYGNEKYILVVIQQKQEDFEVLVSFKVMHYFDACWNIRITLMALEGVWF